MDAITKAKHINIYCIGSPISSVNTLRIVMSQVSHWKKLDHVTFALMLPFLALELFQHNTMNIAAVLILWAVAFAYDVYEHYSEER